MKSRLRRSERVVLRGSVSLFLFLLAAGPALAQDNQAPTLVGDPVVDPASVDVSGGAQEVTVTMTLEDATGVSSVTGQFVSGANESAGFFSASLASGTAQSGTWEATFDVAGNVPSDTYLLTLSVLDEVFNFDTVESTAQLVVTGGDGVSPEVVGTPTITPSSIPLTEGVQTVTVEAVVADDASGVGEVNAVFANSAGGWLAIEEAALIDGDTAQGTWSVEIQLDPEFINLVVPEGNLYLIMVVEDAAGNFETVETGLELTLEREQAVVDFHVDLRLMERLGLYERGTFFEPVMKVYLDVFDGPEAGVYELSDGFDVDSVWTVQLLMTYDQTAAYAFAVDPDADGVDTGDWVYERGGVAGSRTVTLAQEPVTLAVVPFDDRPVVPVDLSYDARVAHGFPAGASGTVVFDEAEDETLASLSFSSLSAPALVAVRRYAADPGGTPPAGIAVVSPGQYWGVEAAPEAASFEATLSFDYGRLSGIAAPEALRLLRREGPSAPWTVVPTSVDTDARTLAATGLDGFSEWTVGSTTAENPLEPRPPGLASSPVPADGEVRVAVRQGLTWAPADFATAYDLYLWSELDPEPTTPLAENLTTPSFPTNPFILQRNTTYSWYVVAKNLDGETQGPVWSFTTEVLPDLEVSDFIVPATAASGQELELQWTVTNVGEAGTDRPSWSDIVRLSPDPNFLNDVRQIGAAENASALPPGEQYIQTVTVTMPEGISGTYFVQVEVNIGRIQGEADDHNNTALASMDVALAPSPDLQVTEVVAPANAFSGQAVDVTWTVTNDGPGTASGLGGWHDAVYLSETDTFDPESALLLSSTPRQGALASGSSYTAASNVVLPREISGAHHFFVVADASEVIFENLGEDNNTGVSGEMTVTLSPPPDLAVTAVTIAEAAQAGATLDINWTVENQGPGSLTGGGWQDRVYLSEGSTFDRASARVLQTVGRFGTLEPDGQYLAEATVRIPDGLSGAYQVVVEADWKDHVFEHTFEENNTAAAGLALERPSYPDLDVVRLEAPSNVQVGEAVEVRWGVQNAGEGAAAPAWEDRLYLSERETWDTTAVLLVAVPYADAVQADAEYNRVTRVTIPAGRTGSYYLHLVSDAGMTRFEYPDDAANNVQTQAISIAAAPPSDLAVTAVTVPAGGQSGAPATVAWTVRNDGAARTSVPVWEDVVYLSTDLRADPQNDIVLARADRTQGLPPGSSYERQVEVDLPDGVSGAFNVLVHADATGAVDDADRDNNTASGPISVTLSPAADLAPVSFEAPDESVAGQPVTLQWTVENEGQGEADGAWYDAVYLSADKSINLFDLKLGVRERATPLSIGAQYQETLEIATPFYATGTYYLILAVDDGSAVFEGAQDDGNTVVHQVTLTLPPPSDLVVTSVTVPDLATPGEEVTLSWTVENQGANPAQGFLRDAVYISADEGWSIEDPLLGTEPRVIDLAPGASMVMARKVDLSQAYLADAEGNITGELPGVPPGAYHAIVRVDIQNNIRESNDANNATASAEVMTTQVPALEIGGSVASTLAPGASRYYRIDVPPGVETFSLVLTSDTPAASNELYVRAGTVPTRTEADVRSREPFAAEHTLYVPVENAVEGGEYYVLLYGREGPAAGLAYTLAAEAVAFELNEIDLAEGGRGGRVTVRMQGAAFGTRIRALLENGAERILARALVQVSPVEAYATFDLADAPLGDYDFVLERNESYLVPDTSPSSELPVFIDENIMRSILPGAFRVVPPQKAAPEVSVLAPPALRTEQEFTVSIEVTNRGNNDLVSPLLLVWTDPATRSSLHPEGGLTEGVRRVFMAGPAPLSGVLRPGATHRVVLSAEAPATPAAMGFYAVPVAGSGIPFSFDAELRAALLDGEGLVWGGAIDRLRFELGVEGWAGYEARLAEAASRLARQERRETDGARLLVELVRGTYQNELTPPYQRQGLIGTNTAAGKAPEVLNLDWMQPLDADTPDCSPTTLAYQTALLEGIAFAFTLEDICDAPNGGAHLDYFVTGTPGGVETVVYGDDSEIASKIRDVQYSEFSYAEVHQAVAAAFKANLEQQILSEGCEGPSLQSYPDRDLGDLGITVQKPNFYPPGATSSIPWNDPFDDEEEEIGRGLRTPQCDLITAFGGFQEAGGRVTNIRTRKMKDPASNECYEGCTILYQATLEYEFGDEYGFNENDTGEYDIVAKNLRDCGIAKEYKTKVKMQETISGVVRIPLTRRDCEPPPPLEIPIIPPGPPVTWIPVLNSKDPNDIIGPAGYGDEKWVPSTVRLPYKIRFENDPEQATAPAQVVNIEQVLDSTLDVRSFRLGAFGFGSFRFEPPENTAAYVERLDLTDSLGIFVDVSAGIDVETHRAFWTLRSIDPSTARAPADPYAGFLPVNDSLGAGEGFVDYLVRAAPTAQTGDLVHARARIVFDGNEAIDTPEIFNTIDAGRPTSRVRSAQFQQDTTAFEVTWTAQDDTGGSGLATYDLYVSRDGGPFEVYRRGLEDESLLFNAERNHLYQFFTVASDQAGNLESFKSEADAVVRVGVEAEEVPTAFALDQNYPNPFNPITTVPYALPQPGDVELIVYNVLGQRVLRYWMGAQQAGRYQQRLDMSRLASGVYFYELRVRNDSRMAFRDVKKLIFVK